MPPNPNCSDSRLKTRKLECILFFGSDYLQLQMSLHSTALWRHSQLILQVLQTYLVYQKKTGL